MAAVLQTTYYKFCNPLIAVPLATAAPVRVLSMLTPLNNKHQAASQSGFSLLELLTVITIATVLLALSMTSLQSTSKREYRLLMQSQMLAIAGNAEAYFLAQHHYQQFTINTNQLPNSLTQRYTVSLTLTDNTYTIIAQPKNSQQDDGALWLNQLGEQRHYATAQPTGSYHGW